MTISAHLQHRYGRTSDPEDFQQKGLEKDINLNQKRLRKKYHQDQLIGNCPAMVELFKAITACAQNDCKTVLLLGESGTGKELVKDEPRPQATPG